MAEISSELRAIEREVDNFHLANPLMHRPFAEAAWYFLAFCEDIFANSILTPESANLQEMAVIADHVVEHMKWPLRWLRASCRGRGAAPSRYDGAMYQASSDLFGLAEQYNFFESAFTYANMGVIRLERDGQAIRSIPDLRDDLRYEGYDRLVKPELIQTEIDLASFLQRITKTVRISGGKFSYELNPGIVRDGLDALKPNLDWKFKLPDNWQLGRYSIGDFQKIAKVLYVLSSIHLHARIIAAQKGCDGIGYEGSLIVMQREELLKRLMRYTGLGKAVVGYIVEDLTYGARDISQPDPALQPLVSLSQAQYCISPSLIYLGAAERNFIVLLNKLPAEKKIYSRLSGLREDLSRQRIQAYLQGVGFRFWYGRIPGWDEMPDLDLAVISDEERQCLLLELKSFLEPAEVREVVERSKEIARGIQQVVTLRQVASHNAAPLRQALAVDDTYKLTWAVASETFVGIGRVQRSEVPVIRTQHILRKLKNRIPLAEVCRWLEDREYLPTEGIHYAVEEVQAQIGGWVLPWYSSRPLVEGEYV